MKNDTPHDLGKSENLEKLIENEHIATALSSTACGRRELCCKHDVASAAVFLLPILAIVTSFGMSLIQLVMLFTVAFLGRHTLLAFYREHGGILRWIVLGFAGYFVVSLIKKFVFDMSVSVLDGPSRLLFALSCIVFVVVLKPRLRWFWVGVCIAGVSSAIFAVLQRVILDMGRVEGYMHHAISFGDLSLAMGLLSLCALSEFRKTNLVMLPFASLACGLLASILSGSRGGWIALFFVLLPLLYYGRGIHGKSIMLAISAALVLFAVAYAIPATGVAHRIEQAFSEVSLYFNQGNATTSVGIRLELWKASWIMFSSHPILGVGRDQFFPTLQMLAQQGVLPVSPALEFSSSHNDILHFLATGGLLDLSFLLFMYVAPLRIFLAVLNHPEGRSSSAAPAALAGVFLVMCFIGFGLTDVMFWLMIPKVFYGMMVCVLIGFCLPTLQTLKTPTSKISK